MESHERFVAAVVAGDSARRRVRRGRAAIQQRAWWNGVKAFVLMAIIGLPTLVAVGNIHHWVASTGAVWGFGGLVCTIVMSLCVVAVFTAVGLIRADRERTPEAVRRKAQLFGLGVAAGLSLISIPVGVAFGSINGWEASTGIPWGLGGALLVGLIAVCAGFVYSAIHSRNQA